eukprot:scaffold143055_cov18-Tisochrysis_lutea.AAC.2
MHGVAQQAPVLGYRINSCHCSEFGRCHNVARGGSTDAFLRTLGAGALHGEVKNMGQAANVLRPY